MAEGDPIWLRNMEMELTRAAEIEGVQVYRAGPNALLPFTPGDVWRYDRASVTLAILNGYVQSIERWLETHLVAGTPRVQRVYQHYQGFCNWAALDPHEVGALAPLLGVVKRLKGLQ